MEGIFLYMHFSNLSKQTDRYLHVLDRQSICVTVYNMLGLQRETTTKKPLNFTFNMHNMQQLNIKTATEYKKTGCTRLKNT